MTGSIEKKIVCDTCSKEITNGYLSRHSKYCQTRDEAKNKAKERAKEYYKNNKDKILLKYKDNKDKAKEYYIENAERIKERQKVYTKENENKIKEKSDCCYCKQSVSKYYLKKHELKCHLNNSIFKEIDEGKKDFTFN